MSEIIEIKVPNIGEFENIEIIEVFVSEGDQIEAEKSLITLESDKATMEVPSPESGIIQEVHVQVGDKVSEGTVILTLLATPTSSFDRASGNPHLDSLA